MPAAVQNPRFQQFLVKLFGLRESRAFDVEDIVLPTVPVLDPADPSLVLARGERLWMGSNFAAASVGNFSFVRLENPTANVLVIVRAVIPLSSGGVILVRVSTQQSLGVGAAGGDQRPLDGRGVAVATLSGCDVRAGNRAAPLGVGLAVNAPQNSTGNTGHGVLSVPAILPPGWAVEIEGSAANTGIYGSFVFSSRTFDVSEAT